MNFLSCGNVKGVIRVELGRLFSVYTPPIYYHSMGSEIPAGLTLGETGAGFRLNHLFEERGNKIHGIRTHHQYGQYNKFQASANTHQLAQAGIKLPVL
jgi:hypothetical protein